MKARNYTRASIATEEKKAGLIFQKNAAVFFFSIYISELAPLKGEKPRKSETILQKRVTYYGLAITACTTSKLVCPLRPAITDGGKVHGLKTEASAKSRLGELVRQASI